MPSDLSTHLQGPRDEDVEGSVGLERRRSVRKEQEGEISLGPFHLHRINKRHANAKRQR